jgi:two-component system, NtrC family, nitrogen regulation response regulator NtrX
MENLPKLTVPRILVVDDDLQMRDFLTQHLTSRGYCINTAGSGGEALEMARDENFDLMICDLKMPLMDGIACMEAVTKIDPTLHVIFLSGEATLEKAVSAMKKGACDFLQKPPRMEDLLLCIDRALRLKQVFTHFMHRLGPSDKAAA